MLPINRILFEMYNHNHGSKHKENSRQNPPRLHLGTTAEPACIGRKGSVESQTSRLQRTLPICVQIIEAVIVLSWRVHFLQRSPHMSEILGLGAEARTWTFHPKPNLRTLVFAVDWTSLLYVECVFPTFGFLLKTLLRYSMGRLGESPCWN